MHLLRDDLILGSSHNVAKGDPNWMTLFDLTEELAVEYWCLSEAPKSWCGSCVKRRGPRVSCTDHTIETGPRGECYSGADKGRHSFRSHLQSWLFRESVPGSEVHTPSTALPRHSFSCLIFFGALVAVCNGLACSDHWSAMHSSTKGPALCWLRLESPVQLPLLALAALSSLVLCVAPKCHLGVMAHVTLMYSP